MLPLFASLLTSVPGTMQVGVYNTSATPSSLPWNTYNYCNAPHVSSKHYALPKEPGVKLVYLNVAMRHHKRTPDNLYPNENSLNSKEGWDCTNFLQYSYGSSDPAHNISAQIYHETETPEQHPFISQIWNGTCDEGQLTRGGLDDSIQHGKDFWSVYNGRLGFLSDVDEGQLYVRTSSETRTFQVAGGMLYGMDPHTRKKAFKVHNQPSSIDSLVPSYSCPAADAIRNAYQSIPAWTDHLDQNADLKARLDDTLGTAGLSGWASWYDHFFDTFTSRTCHGHALPCNSTGGCVSEADADRVFALGDWEYNYIWNGAVNATDYVDLTYGVMFGELATNLLSFKAGTERYRTRLYVGHDGSMIRLAAGLGLGHYTPLRWPALGSEIVIEVWEDHSTTHFVRVIHEGTPVYTLSLDSFIELLQSRTPADIFSKCITW